MPQKSGTLIINFLFTRLKWCRRVARSVLSDYRFHSSITAVIDELGWVSDAKEQIDLIIYNHKWLHTRSPDISNISTTNNHHQMSPSFTPATNTTSYQANFFYCTIKDWNDLPLNFYSIPTLSSFINSTISAHINGCNNTYNI